MKTLTLLLLTALSCFAQYALQPYQAYSTGTNSSLLANTNVSTASFYMGAGNYCIVWGYGELVSTNVEGTNPITVTLRKGPLGSTSYQSNFATFTLTAASNTTVYGWTKVDVSDALYMSATITNQNSTNFTNFLLHFDQKRGL